MQISEIAKHAAELHLDKVYYLAQSGADPNTGNYQTSAIAYLINKNSNLWTHETVYSKKYPKSYFNKLDKFYRMLHLLLSVGANPSYGMPMAARFGNITLIKYLIHRGGNYNYKSLRYPTLEDAALTENNHKVALYLVALKRHVARCKTINTTALSKL